MKLVQLLISRCARGNRWEGDVPIIASSMHFTGEEAFHLPDLHRMLGERKTELVCGVCVWVWIEFEAWTCFFCCLAILRQVATLA